MPRDLPDWAYEEQAFAEWCTSHKVDETDENWSVYEEARGEHD